MVEKIGFWCVNAVHKVNNDAFILYNKYGKPWSTLANIGQNGPYVNVGGWFMGE